MEKVELLELLGGALAWLTVAAVAYYAAENWDPFWGFFPVLGAVVLAWWAGEEIVGTANQSRGT